MKEQDELKSNNKTTPKKKSTKISNNNQYSYNDNYQSSNTDSNIDSILDEDDNSRIVTRRSTRQKTFSSGSNRRHSTRKVVTETKSRISFMCKFKTSIDFLPMISVIQVEKYNKISFLANDQASTDDDVQKPESPVDKSEQKTLKIQNTPNEQVIQITCDNHNLNNNNSMELSEEILPNEISLNDSTTTSLILRITPNSTSSISITRIDGDNGHANEKVLTENRPNNPVEPEIVDETDQVEKIEAVRNNEDGISFRIKLIKENQSQWISSKIANLKYPQAIITFWESHVQFV